MLLPAVQLPGLQELAFMQNTTFRGFHSTPLPLPPYPTTPDGVLGHALPVPLASAEASQTCIIAICFRRRGARIRSERGIQHVHATPNAVPARRTRKGLL
jgi:hypothetical protein